jgi:metal-responsive CopG/Arc/MetJ family transcriptional regulator
LRGVVGVSSYQRMVNVSFKIEASLLAELNEIAKLKGTSRSELIRRAIAWYIKSYMRPTVTPKMTIYDGTTKVRAR